MKVIKRNGTEAEFDRGKIWNAMAKKKHGETLGKIAKADAREKMLAYFAKTIRKQKPVESFSEQLWNTVTDYVTVDKDGKLAYRFKNGSEVSV